MLNFLDVVGMISLSIASGAVAFMLVMSLARLEAERYILGFVLAAWFGIVIWLSTTGLFEGPWGTYLVGAASALPVLISVGFFCFSVRARAVLLASPLAMLVALHFVRLFGGEFLLLQAAGRLAWPFAPIAGWGDIVVGLAAVPVAYLLRANIRGSHIAAMVFTVFGVADLATAVSLGVTSAPGSPLQLFFEQRHPVLTLLPWLLIPAFLVPCFFVAHFAALMQLLSGGRQRSAAPHAATPI